MLDVFRREMNIQMLSLLEELVLEFFGSKDIDYLRDKFEILIESKNWLDSLRAAGVDNWEGISYAGEIFEKERKEKFND